MHRNMNRVRAGRRQATSMLEFVIVLPLFLVLILFIIDMSRLLMVHSAVQEATYRAARAGAAYGGGQTPDGAAVSAKAFQRALDETPGASAAHVVSTVVTTGQVCQSSGTNSFVQIDSVYTVDLITPGLGGLLNLLGSSDTKVDNEALSATSYTLHSTSVARCEVAGS